MGHSNIAPLLFTRVKAVRPNSMELFTVVERGTLKQNRSSATRRAIKSTCMVNKL